MDAHRHAAPNTTPPRWWTRRDAPLWRAAIATFIIALAIAIVTLLPSENLPSVAGGDRLHHVIAMACLAFPVSFVRPRLVPLIFSLALLYGAMIELIQPFSGRSRSLADIGFNVIGTISGATLGMALHLLGKQLGHRPAAWSGRRRV